ncbi:TetR/AcrR family transcriptional regulator [Arthrobacter castelli]|uniref:TetR/AcrR family transcriptional regulator n=1 Tax=Arthrobacter castelli TaxID=271431 RepID=UPI00041FCC3E|nr:TetR/AcrR family transcriptional regulator [Arthrobacter castelli]
MATTTAAARKTRDKAARRADIINHARALAEADGWEAVTTRRLADAIEYSQPVLYSHFPGGMAEIMNSVALEGFSELASVAGSATNRHNTDRTRLRAVVDGYLDFAAAHPAVYAAMFTLPIRSRFAAEETDQELLAAFDQLAAILRDRANPPRDIDTSTELLWSALHGLATLDRDGRLRDTARRARAELLVEIFLQAP